MPVTCRVVCRGVCSGRCKCRGEEDWDVSRVLLLFGKGGIAVFDSAFLGIIVGSGSRQILQAEILMTRPELGMTELHSRKLWHVGARGSSINFQTI